MSDMLLQQATIVVTGAKGVGKTFFATMYAKPSQVGLVYYDDSERSANRVVQSLQENGLSFGYYGDLSARFADTLPATDDLLHRINTGKMPWLDSTEKGALLGYYKYIVETLDEKLNRGKYKVYVMDTLEKFEAGMAAYVEENFKLWGYRSLKDSKRHGRFWSDCVYSLYEQLVAAIFARGVETIILCSHLRTPWQDNKPVPGKVAPAGKKLLHRLSSLMVWLVSENSNADGAPAGLILKERMGKMTMENDRWVPRTMLPRRIPHCTWEDIDRYLSDGCDLANPAEGETMTMAEREMISELLTNQQMKLMIADAQRDLEERRAANGTGGGVVVPPGGTSFTIPTVDPLVTKWVEKVGGLDIPIEEKRERVINSFPAPLRKSKGVRVADAVMRILEGGK